MRNIGVYVAVLLSTLVPPGERAAQAQDLPPTLAPAPAVQALQARVIVKYRSDSVLLRKQALAATPDPGRAERLGQRAGLVLRSGASVAERSHVVFGSGMSSQALALRLSQEADVEYAVVDQRRRRLAVVPNDPLYLPAVPPPGGPAVGQWYLKPPDSLFVSAIDAPAAWAVTQGSASIVVAVLDTGVRFDHEDLKRVGEGGNLLPGYDFVTDVATANDGDGRDVRASATSCSKWKTNCTSAWWGRMKRCDWYRMRFVVPAPVCLTPIARMAPSCFSVLLVWARPSCARCWLISCSIPKIT